MFSAHHKDNGSGAMDNDEFWCKGNAECLGEECLVNLAKSHSESQQTVTPFLLAPSCEEANQNIAHPPGHRHIKTWCQHISELAPPQWL